MNKSYRTVWNATTGTWAAAEETARARGKSTSHVKSAIASAVAMMAGVGGAMPADALAQAANGAGGLTLCGATGGVNGMAYGSGTSTGTALTAACTANSSRLSLNHPMAFQLYNNTTTTGGGTGVPTAATEVGIGGSKDGHLMLVGGSGVHIAGATDFANNVSMTNNRIQNLAAGTAGTDAVNVNQLNAAISAADDPYVAFQTGTYAPGVASQAVGSSSTAIGPGATAGSTSAVALGGAASAGYNAVALGTISAAGYEGTAVGVQANSGGNQSVAVGRAANASAAGAVALGSFSIANRANTVSVGSAGAERQIVNVAAGTQGTDAVNLSQMNAAIAAADPYVAISTGLYGAAAPATVAGVNSAVAVGANASATGVSAVALGGNTVANADNAMALGTISRATAANTTAIGVGSSATQTGAVAVGRSAVASAAGAVALGQGSVANRANTVSVGSAAVQRQITNVAAGTATTDAVNLGQLNAAIAGVGGTSNPYVKVNSGGAAAAANGVDSIAIGQGANTRTGSTNSIAIGNGAGVTNNGRFVPVNGIAIGNSARVADGDISGATGAIALGDSAFSVGGGGIAIGANSRNTNSNTVALGNNSYATGPGTTAMGSGATANSGYSVALGLNATAAGSNAVALGANSVATRGDAVSIGSSSLQRQITNMAAGTQATDAVNVSQLTGVTHALGGGAAVGADGSITQPKYSVGGNDYDNVGDALDALAQTGGANAVNYDDATRDTVTLAGANGTTITNVKAGTLSATSTDAVNGSQLFATNQNVSDLSDALKNGGVIDPVTGQSLAVVYDGAAKDTVTLAGANGTTLTNVKAGVADMDAVNVSQLKDAGLIDPTTGKPIAAVTYDLKADGSPDYGSVTLGNGNGPVKVTNVADATGDSDALNLGQLKKSGLVGDDGQGNLTSLAVTYDDATKSGVTLGNAGTPVAIHNVADGALSATSKDAVNGSQLFATNQNLGDLSDSLKNGGVIDPATGQSLAVVYDGTAKDTVTLAGANGTTLTNVKAGVADMDAVNVSQLKGSGLIDPVTGQSIAAVTYDRNADGTPNYGSVTLGQGNAPVTVSNVADGALSATSKDAVNGSQLFATNQNLGDLSDSLKNGGVIDPATGQSLAVVYDDAAKNHVSLGGAGASAPVTVSNVAAGVAATDAVNVQQMQQAVATGNPYIGGRGNGVAAQATGINAVALGLGSLANEVNTISVGNGATGLQRRITNVQDGQADSDAATVGQMNSLVGATTSSVQTAIDDAGTKTRSAIQAMNDRIDAIGTNAVVGTDPYVKVDGQGDGSDNAFVGANTAGVAIGAEASATGTTAVAVGAQSVASGNASLAFGAGASATSAGAVAIGGAKATSANAVALGNGTSAAGTGAVALGFNTVAGGSNALAFGNTARANGTDSVAFGRLAQANVANAIAIGSQATAAQANSIALGSRSVADRMDSVAVGSANAQRQIIYVAKGTADTDAVNVSQLRDAVSAFGGNASVQRDGSIANPTYTVGGTAYHNVGDAIDALSQLGGGGSNPFAVTYAKNPDGSANFELVSLAGPNGTKITNVQAGDVSATSTDAVNGSQLYSTAKGVADSLGGGATANSDGSFAPPAYTLTDPAGTGTVTYNNVGDALDNLDSRTVVNTGAIADVKDQLADSGLVDANGDTRAVVTYDKNADGSPNYGSVTLGDGHGPVKVTNVADGTLSATSTDAVNGAQLFATNEQVGQNTTNITNLTNNLNNGTIGLVQQDQASRDITVAAATDGTKVNFAGTAGNRVLTGVAAGAVNATSVDAVNGAQLHGVSSSVAASLGGGSSVGADGSLVQPSYTVNGNTYNNVGDAIDAAARSGSTDPNSVQYDGAAHDRVTLGGTASTTPVTLTNVADGTLSATSTDAVNGSQLFATNQNVSDLSDSLKNGGVIDPITGKSLAVVYDGAAKDTVTLAGANGTTLTNVKAGVADMDAVNVSQLKGSGLIDPVTGQPIAAVTYDQKADGTPDYGSVTLGNGNGPVKVTNVADAKGDSDALNLGQLKKSGLVGDDGQGNLTSLAVTYDDATKSGVTLGNAGTPVAIHNVADGALSATSKDAVNGSQLFATNQNLGDLSDSLKNGGVIDPVTGESLAVVYDGKAKDSVTLGNAGTPVAIHNVADGVLSATSKDAVNGSQLFATNQNLGDLSDSLKNGGVIDPITGQSLAVVYDNAAKNHVTLGGAGSTGLVTLSNVAEGAVDTDAVNFGQLKDYVAKNPGGPGNPLAVAYDDATRGTVTLGGGAAGTTVTNVKAGTLSATSTDAVNGSQLFATNQNVSDLSDALKNGGVIDPVTGQSLAVVYDGAAKDTVTLAGANGTTLTNVKAGVADMDAVNVSQLKDAGLIDPTTGKPIAAVTYDLKADGSPDYGSVTLGNGNGPVKVTNVADATGDSDAMNLGQLKQAGLVGEDGQGNLTSLAVTYDDATKSGVTLGNAGTPVAIHNVADGVLSATSKDAVNGSQLFATNQNLGDLSDSLKNGGVIDPVTGQSLAVVYDSAAKDTVTLGGANASAPVQLKNVAAGADDTDAVNVAQLKDVGLVAPIDPTNPGAGLASLAVTYGKHADGSANFDEVKLAGANGTTITNVKAGAVTETSTDAINGAQLHGVSQSVADSLGGGSTVGADGTVTNPTYSLADPADASQKQDYHNVGDALANLDGRTVDNTKNITVIKNQLSDSGLVDPVTGQSIAAVTYDRKADGTPDYGSVTLGNGNGPVKLSNVADGVARNDAVNVGQLQDAGLVAPIDPNKPGTMTSLAVTYGKNTDGSANFDQVMLAGKSGTTISNVKAGAVTATSMDAVNGAQLHGVAQSVADSLGGGSTVDPDGKVTSPTYVVNKQTFNNVGDAITNISNSLVDGSIGLVQQDATTRDITVAKDTDGTTVDFTGTAGDRVLTGVAAGAVSATSHDAINGSQLYGTAQSVADTIGGGTTVGADGKLANTAIEVNGNKYSTVEQAVQAAAAYGATDSLAVRYDLNRDGSPNYGSVTLGGTGAAPVILTNVADGVNKYDAVNFGQLSELNDKIGDMDGRVGALEQNPGNGGGSGDNPYFAGTDVTAGSSTAANAGTGTGNTAAGSGANIGSGANNATVIGSNASATQDSGTAIGSGAKSTAEGAVAIGAGSVANEANTVSFGNGTDDGNRRIVNIADGINATDAASKGQLDRAVGGLQGQINDVSKNAYSGIAAATALTMIPGVDAGKTLSFGVGGATYKGYQAVAFGGEARITQNLKMKAGVGLSSGGNTVGVGASYQW
ncbi:YadA-like family protein [Burkholderia sp. NRF60-BP8]|uniref:YadA-like family protein n=1 Tax=Burkholderia sp. NRF60-BP8 TaxID=1637853 RepID=UPI0008554449|nr:YadA-like family protein [Burkholderia sp. NRF60-BP8]AOI74958.1 hypothetical protein WS54_00995 [Burkholderia sp. NRF60-BP8]